MSLSVPNKLSHWQKTFDRLFARWEIVEVGDLKGSVSVIVKSEVCYLSVSIDSVNGETLQFWPLQKTQWAAMSGAGIRTMIGSESNVGQGMGEKTWIEVHARLLRHWSSVDTYNKMQLLHKEYGARITSFENALLGGTDERKAFLLSRVDDFVERRLSGAIEPRSRSIIFRSSRFLKRIMLRDFEVVQFSENPEGVVLALHDTNFTVKLDIGEDDEVVSIRPASQGTEWLSVPQIGRVRVFRKRLNTLESQLDLIKDHWCHLVSCCRESHFAETLQLVKELDEYRLKKRHLLLNPYSPSE